MSYVLGIVLEPTIETVLLTIPASTILGLAFLIIKPERLLVRAVTHWRMLSGTAGSVTKGFLAHSILYIRPWRSSWSLLQTIDVISSKYADRVIASQEVREDVYRVEGAVYLTVISYPLITLFNLDTLLSLASLLAIWGLVIIILYQSSALPERFRNIMLAQWLFDSLSESTQRRDQSTYFRSLGKKHIRYVNIIARLVSILGLVVTRDWDGFQNNFHVLQEDLENVTLREAKNRTFEEYLRDWLFVLSTRDPEIAEVRAMVVANATPVISDAICTIAGWPGLPPSDRFRKSPSDFMLGGSDVSEFASIRLLVPMLSEAQNWLSSDKRRPSLKIRGPELYSHLDRAFIASASTEFFDQLVKFPRRTLEIQKGTRCEWKDCSKDYAERVEILACSLIQSMDAQLWDASEVLPTLVKWEVDFTRMSQIMVCPSLLGLMTLDLDLKPYCIRELIKPSLARCHEKVKDAILMKLTDPRMASEKESIMIVLSRIVGGSGPAATIAREILHATPER